MKSSISGKFARRKSLAMKKLKWIFAGLMVFMLLSLTAASQCSICSKTAQQLGDKGGRGLNGGILYLAAAPFLVAGFIGYRWWKSNK